ncbi:MFS transporter, DHA1 family, bicyclomycin/chloramphenicol resistance protein [Sphingomonas sp. YR710]|uniref:multidrug effflux MFS transporter n=1 Tax=Sphingomonas sp. YR710 TaxID=1882773 RepID=UPI0008848508|nr:multidrug effflux MFS transporter [Sphingomonas sp. YR710]SDC61401.1 MFS transporter, DHA1 family, bicyclomycin/chloramphenicol resistance protein [Sphingomonas sp. YR710]
MTAPAENPTRLPHPGISFREFVAMMAALMAVNALGIDTMLPALPAIAADLGVTIENHQQWIVAFYAAGFGIAQLFFGPIADHFGRRRVLISAMVVYAGMCFAAAQASSFPVLLAARFIQGLGAASTRVLSVSIVRDCYSGRRMARVTSLIFMVFLSVPVMAPSIGQAIMLVAPWHWIFYGLGIFAFSIAIWAAMRLPETLEAARRRPVRLKSIGEALALTITNRYSRGYTLAMSCMFGAMMGFLNSSQQIFADVFGRPKLFPIVFAGIAGSMALASLINSRIVERFGSRRVSHTALLGVIATATAHVLIIVAGKDTLVAFCTLQTLTMFFFGLTGSNFGAMAMEEMSEIAGSAASVQGFVSTLGGAGIGLLIGQSFNGTTLPLVLGFAANACVALAIVFVTERGRLFRAHHVRPADIA